MQKITFTIVLLIVSLIVATKIQSFVKNNRPNPVPVVEDTTDYMMSTSTEEMASSTDYMASTTETVEPW